MNRKLAMLTVIGLLAAGYAGMVNYGWLRSEVATEQGVSYAISEATQEAVAPVPEVVAQSAPHVPTQEEVYQRESEEVSRSINRRLAEEEAQRLEAKRAEENRRANRQRETSNADERYTLRVQVTAYTADEPGDTGVAYDGRPAIAYQTLAVDPRVIPLGSKVYVPGYGWFLAHDTGGAVKGNIIDMRLGGTTEANNWGRRTLEVIVIPPKEKYKMAW